MHYQQPYTEVVDSLMGKLSDSHSDVRSAAAQALGSIATSKPELITEEVVDTVS